jgi:hypothetical protein
MCLHSRICIAALRWLVMTMTMASHDDPQSSTTTTTTKTYHPATLPLTGPLCWITLSNVVEPPFPQSTWLTKLAPWVSRRKKRAIEDRHEDKVSRMKLEILGDVLKDTLKDMSNRLVIMSNRSFYLQMANIRRMEPGKEAEANSRQRPGVYSTPCCQQGAKLRQC